MVLLVLFVMTFDIKFLEFDDFDRFREVLSGWDTEPTQLSAGPLSLRLGQLDLGDLHVSRLRLNQSTADRMAIESNLLMYVVCLAPNIFCGLEVPEGSLVVFGPGREYRSLLSKNWDSFEVIVECEVAEAAGLPHASATSRELAPELSVTPLSEALIKKFRLLANELFDPYWSNLAPVDRQLWADAARERTLRLLAAASGHGLNLSAVGPELKRVPLYELALAGLNYIDRHRNARLTVRELGQALGVSERALQYAFCHALGLSPSQYILARRLHAARRDLLATNNRPASVTNVAFNHDFDHLSRFAQYYRRLFGELPSKTKRLVT